MLLTSNKARNKQGNNNPQQTLTLAKSVPKQSWLKMQDDGLKRKLRMRRTIYLSLTKRLDGRIASSKQEKFEGNETSFLLFSNGVGSVGRGKR